MSGIRSETIAAAVSARLQDRASEKLISWRKFSPILAERMASSILRDTLEMELDRFVSQLGESVERALSKQDATHRGQLLRNVYFGAIRHLDIMYKSLSDVVEVEFLEPCWGDFHHHGESTTRVTMADGRVGFFKPRRESKSQLIQGQITRLDALDCFTASPELVLPAGVLQFEVPSDQRQVTSPDEFWLRAGTFLVAAMTMCLRDGHYENVIAANGRVAILDDETIEGALARSGQDPLATLLIEDGIGPVGRFVGAFVATSGPTLGRRRFHIDIRDGLIRTSRRESSRYLRASLTDVYGTPWNHESEFLAGVRAGSAAFNSVVGDADSQIAETSRVVLRTTSIYTMIVERLWEISDTLSPQQAEEKVAEWISKLGDRGLESGTLRSEARQLARGEVPIFFRDNRTGRLFDGDGVSVGDGFVPRFDKGAKLRVQQLQQSVRMALAAARQQTIAADLDEGKAGR